MTALIGMAGRAHAADFVADEAAASREVDFDIPAKSLAAAIDAFSAATGQAFFYDPRLVRDRLSSPVKGKLPPAVALAKLLDGSHVEVATAVGGVLTLRATPPPRAENGVSLDAVPAQAAEPVAPSLYRSYFALVQQGVQRALCTDPETRPGSFAASVAVWLNADGTITKSELLRRTGDSRRDDVLRSVLQRVALGRPPPAGMAQPVVVRVSPWVANPVDPCPN